MREIFPHMIITQGNDALCNSFAMETTSLLPITGILMLNKVMWRLSYIKHLLGSGIPHHWLIFSISNVCTFQMLGIILYGHEMLLRMPILQRAQ